ncbi:MAG TPA: helix-turn-helix domain-containing protein [Candidatus Levilactobacillus faecigallinarum]|uniref:Helix-turn-helix domain-containing protein n=1 Tax=Candidatus Levilactobacillus faecigallinarum TaxID=2838638 RepID=A0A9D1QTR3_9LACO|nr:helix-turn-helix domain-containing protein [Candidatus Levilactobacillus faecigallinarum]
MNTQIFVETRKRMHFSQDQLAQGICTQATLSKFERNGKVPSLKILLRLCDRLCLTLDDLFPVSQEDDSERSSVLEIAENHLLQERYQAVLLALRNLGEPTQDSTTFQLRYYFLRGYATALGDGTLGDALYDFSQILNRLDEGHRTMFSTLAYTGMGIAYNRSGDADRAEFFFNKVANEIRNMQFNQRHNIWRALNILNYTAEYYSQRADFVSSDELLDYGVQICSRYHMTYYLARITYLKALNALHRQDPVGPIRQELRDAEAFARLNGNQRVLSLIAGTLNQLDKQ